jgi:hypothetical protein
MLPTDPLKDGSPKDYLHVQYSDGNAATVAYKYLSEAFDKKGIRVDFATERNDPRLDSTEEHTPIPPSSDLFIGNIPFEASESEIAALFNDQPGFIELKLGRVAFYYYFYPPRSNALCMSHSDGLFRSQQRDCKSLF